MCVCVCVTLKSLSNLWKYNKQKKNHSIKFTVKINYFSDIFLDSELDLHVILFNSRKCKLFSLPALSDPKSRAAEDHFVNKNFKTTYA